MGHQPVSQKILSISRRKRLDAIPCYEHVGESGAVDANLQELRHQALLSLAWFFCSP
jgi:hypothetical protein